MLRSSFQKQPHFSALGEKGGVDAPQREEKWRGEKGEVKRKVRTAETEQLVGGH